MKTELLQIHPVLAVADMSKTITYYEDKLGFVKRYDSLKYGSAIMDYAVVLRENIEIHFQLFDMIDKIIMPQFRIQVKNIDRLYQEYIDKEVLKWNKEIKQTPWEPKSLPFMIAIMLGLPFMKRYA